MSAEPFDRLRTAPFDRLRTVPFDKLRAHLPRRCPSTGSGHIYRGARACRITLQDAQRAHSRLTASA